MNSLMGGCDPSDLRPGDEVEFLISVSHKTQKTSATHVKKLRWGLIRNRGISCVCSTSRNDLSSIVEQYISWVQVLCSHCGIYSGTVALSFGHL